MRGLLRSLKTTYLTADPRSLGVFRIGLGLVLLADLARRWYELDFWYTNAGLLPNHTLLWRPPASRMFSLFFVASSREEATVGFVLCAGVFALFTLGYRTRFMHVLALIARVSLNSRLAVLENGGDMVLNLLCIFTMFMPLGRRFSLDAWFAALRAREQAAPESPRTAAAEPVVSIAMFALILQFSAIYFFNAISKDGAAWRDGFAVHYALHQDKLVTSLGVWMREQLPLDVVRPLTRGVLLVEWAGFALILSPVLIHHARALAIVMMPLLHLGFALGLNLGGFSPAMMAFFPLLLTERHWGWLEQRAFARGLGRLIDRAAQRLEPWALALVRATPAPFLAPWQKARAVRLAPELLAGLLMAAVVSEALNDNTSVPQALRVSQPRWAKAMVEYPRLLQGWRMFAPDPPTMDTMVHVDAVTAEGKHVDPYNLVASRQPFPDGKVVPTRMDQSQFFTMYSDRIPLQQYAAYRHAFHDWLLAYPQRTGRAEDCLVSFEVYYVVDRTPPPGSTTPTPVERTRFMEYRAPANGPCKPLKRGSGPGELRAQR